MQKPTPCLWFDGNAEEAMDLYCSIFPNSKVLQVARYGDAGPGAKGSAMTVNFTLDGQEILILNGGPHYKLTPAFSLSVLCETQEEVDRLWARLLEGGAPSQCGWLTDRFGVSWQIVPKILPELLQDKDRAKANRVMQAMLKMVKLDIAELKKAYEQQ
jgi:predicted 3-demethylubiquinone-9 3-methyltransferase (glyoxalase superfamily)